MSGKSITPERMRLIEEEAERLGVPRILLMENAGRGVMEYLERRFSRLKGKKMVIVAGTGNNGGDGFVVARHAAGEEAEVTVVLLGRPADLRTDESSRNWRALEHMERTVRLVKAPDKQSIANVSKLVEDADIVIDAIFGTGIKGQIRDPHSTAIDLINHSKGFKLAVDIPSGLDPLTGEVHDKVVRADATVTFHRMKSGLVGREDITGEVQVSPIGVPPEAET